MSYIQPIYYLFLYTPGHVDVLYTIPTFSHFWAPQGLLKGMLYDFATTSIAVCPISSHLSPRLYLLATSDDCPDCAERLL